ncbi:MULTISPECIES: hypothetical protein [unclassified Nocardioides]|uniref:hypothetical protein n=1 Tax=unclassified Nocardioides TaxID=2615069 RepID=UPI003014E1CA
MAAGAVLVGWFAAGTLRARPVRSVLVAVFLILGALVGAGNLAEAASSSASEVAEALAVLVLGITPLVALLRFRTTSWYAWHRRHPGTVGPDISSLVLVAMLVGALSGLSAPAPEGSPFRLEVRV